MTLIQQHLSDSELELVRKFVKDPVRTLNRIEEVVRTVNRLATNHEVLTENWKDEEGTIWTRPTPWAYAQACKLRDSLQKQVKELERKLMTTQRFSQEQLTMAFNNVQNKEHWKNPIDCVIDNPGEENLACLREAIIHFTGSVPSIEKLKDGKIHVTAAGYYATIGA